MRVIDGDTVEARVHVWLGLDLITHVRVRGIDTPELHGPCPEAAQAARDALANLLGNGPVILTRIANDKYGGRIDAAVALPSGADASTAMLATGHARPWPKAKGDINCPSAAPPASAVLPRSKSRTRATPMSAPE
ncbi:MAG: hypothetical protein H7Z12_03935 [Rhodospirillaceae bacterium]|nr:hypothetical protein [Rhodospirillales bacterium]